MLSEKRQDKPSKMPNNLFSKPSHTAKKVEKIANYDVHAKQHFLVPNHI